VATFALTVLGCSAAIPTLTRSLAAQVLNVHEQLYLIDCGEGTQQQMMRLGVKRNRIDHIFISHLHGDHCFGLIGLLTSYGLLGRKNALYIFSPVGLEEMILTQFRCIRYESPFPIHFHVVDPTQAVQIFENAHLTVRTIPLKHRVPTCGYLFCEKPQPRNIIAAKITELQLTFTDIKAIKNGADFHAADGTFFSNDTLTYEPVVPRSFAYCSDTAFYPPIIEQV
jgi:ribonuclease Z